MSSRTVKATSFTVNVNGRLYRYMEILEEILTDVPPAIDLTSDDNNNEIIDLTSDDQQSPPTSSPPPWISPRYHFPSSRGSN